MVKQWTEVSCDGPGCPAKVRVEGERPDPSKIEGWVKVAEQRKDGGTDVHEYCGHACERASLLADRSVFNKPDSTLATAA